MKLLASMISEYSIDVAVLVEADKLDFDALFQKLPEFSVCDDPALRNIPKRRNKTIVINSSDADIIPFSTPNSRLRFLKVLPKQSSPFLLATLHFVDKSWNGPNDQLFEAEKLRKEIERAERDFGSRRTLVMGDFNMNPFEDGMTDWRSFNSVATRQQATNRSRSRHDTDYLMFYNPMWRFFSDYTADAPGTYYRAQSPISWSIFDQVLLRPEMLPEFRSSSLRIIDSVGGQSLLTKKASIPNKKKTSDHLPVAFETDD